MKTRILGFLLLAALIIMPGRALAAGCTSSAPYGTVSGSLNIPLAGNYVLWSRIYIPDTSHTTYQLDVDGGSCFRVGGSALKANTWTWVNYQNGHTASTITYNFRTTGSHSITLIGVQPGVIVDKVIALGSSERCSSNGNVPKDSGDNCASAAAVTSPREKTQSFVSQHHSALLSSFGITILLAGAVALYIVRKIRRHHRYLIAHDMKVPKL
ncbi:MAG: hypothetical protein JWM81_782 [Candidatus Saccharibacteria bacterium]|nr:hypothetical protein [Candidatus Saccharibacteria bacterium]